MRIMYIKGKYNPKIYLIDEPKKLIFKIDCMCKDFIHRRLKRVGENADKKVYAEPCKHLQPMISALQRIGYTLKIPKPMDGPDKLTAEVRNAIVERSGGICEVEDCTEKALIFHRIIRGSNGGKYTEENTRHICVQHHKEIHASEFPGSKSK